MNRDDIKTWIDPVAPRLFQWCACVGDYDLDAEVGTGATEKQAIDDLLWQLGELDDERDDAADRGDFECHQRRDP